MAKRIKITKRKTFQPIENEDPIEVQRFNLNIGSFSKIIHLSDIHIRPLARHTEFYQVFDNVNHLIQQHNDAIIVVTGDIFDNKSVFKPETFKICRDFLKMLAKNHQTLIIAGNHDLVEANTLRMDALTPVVDSIQNLHYLKDSGVYSTNNVDFVVSSLLDKQFIYRKDIDVQDDKKCIALYHGAFDMQQNANSSRFRQISDFDGFDAVLLGDIHAHTIVKEKPFIAYPGSLIQQNHGEPLHGHGLLIWDSELVPSFIPVHNDWGFVDIHCSDGSWTSDVALPKFCYARLLLNNCTQTQVDLIVSDIKRSTEKLTVSKINVSSHTESNEVTAIDDRTVDEIDIITQHSNDLGFNTEAIIEIHNEYVKQIEIINDESSTAVWKPLHVQFMNMFGFAGDIVNEINFKRGVTSISAPNASGKTSIVNILLFALFGKTPLAPAANAYTMDVVNIHHNNAYVKILIKHGTRYYLIERKTIKKAKSSSSAVVFQKLNKCEFTCDVWESDINGKPCKKRTNIKENNNDTFIKGLLGDIDLFMLDNLLNKDSSKDILAMPPAEQVKALKKIFNIDRYDTLRDINKKTLNDLSKELNTVAARNDGLKSVLVEVDTNELDSLIAQKKCLDEDIEKLNGQLHDAIAKKEDFAVQLAAMESPSDECIDLNTQTLRNQLQSLTSELSSDNSPEEMKLETEIIQQKIKHLESQWCDDVVDNGQLTDEKLQKLINLDFPKPEQDRNWTKSHLRQLQEKLTSISHNLKSLPATTKSKKELLVIEESLEHNLENLSTSKEAVTAKINTMKSINHKEVIDVQEVNEKISKVKALLNKNAGEDVELDPHDSIDSVQEQFNKFTKKNKRTGSIQEIINKLEDVPWIEGKDALEYSAPDAYHALVHEDLHQLLIDNLHDTDSHLANALSLKLKTLKRNNLHSKLSILEGKLTKDAQIEEKIALLSELEKHNRNGEIQRKIDVIQKKLQRVDLQVVQEKLTSQISQCRQVLKQWKNYDDSQEASNILTMRNLIRDKTSLTMKLQSLQNNLKIHEKLVMIQSQLEKIEKHERYFELNQKLQEAKEHLEITKNIIKNANAQLVVLAQQINQLTLKHEQFLEMNQKIQQNNDIIIDFEKKIVPLNQYNIIMGNKGVASIILFKKIKAIENFINGFVKNFTKYSVTCYYDDKKLLTILAKCDGAYISLARLSGFEKLIFQVAFKTALNKFSFVSKSSIIILDEALDCIDSDNFIVKLPDFIHAITMDYSTCLAISQRDITNIVDNSIFIKKTKDSISYIY